MAIMAPLTSVRQRLQFFAHFNWYSYAVFTELWPYVSTIGIRRYIRFGGNFQAEPTVLSSRAKRCGRILRSNLKLSQSCFLWNQFDFI